MKKILMLLMVLCICGCSNMQTITQEDVKDKNFQSDEKIQETIKELDLNTFTPTKENAETEILQYLCDENGEQIINLYLNPDKNGKINTKIFFDVDSNGISSLDGLFFVEVDEKIVPSTIMGGKEMDMHYVSIPISKSLSDISVNLKDIDLSYNHMISFYFVKAVSPNGVVMDITKFIGTEDNKSYMEYMEKIPYIKNTSDVIIKKQIDGYKSEDSKYKLSNLNQMKYQTVFMYGDIFPLTADDNILKQADEEGRELTREEMEHFNFKYEKGKKLEFEILYKGISEDDMSRSGMILVWCNGEWATFDGKQSLIYRQSENGFIKEKGSIQLPDKPGKYELWYLNLDLNDVTGGRFWAYVKKRTVEIK